MTTFKSVHEAGSLRIEKRIADSPVYIELNDGGKTAVALFDPADAPAIALAVLEAAGHEEVLNPNGALESAVESLAVHIRVTEATAADAAEEAARGKRRDELAREFDDSCNVGYAEYDVMPLVVRRAIDRIIDTEQELAKERAK